MATLALQHFGRDVIRRSANGALFLSVEIEFGSQAKITQLDLHLVVEEQVAQFQITVDDAMRVQVFESVDYLYCIALHLELM